MRVRRGFNARELLSSLTSDSRTYQYRPLPSPKSIRLLEVHSIHPSPPSPSPSPSESNSSSSGGATVSVSLRTFPVDDAPLFQALSYTWGYPLIPESRPSRSSNWRRLAFIQRVQARAPRLLDADGRGGTLTSTGTPSGPLVSSSSSSTSLASLLKAKITENTPCFPVKCEGRNLRVTANLHDALDMLARDNRAAGAGSDSSSRTNYVWVDALCIDQSSLTERNQQVSLMADIFQAAQGVTVWLGEEDEFTHDACTVIDRISSIPRDKWSQVPYVGFFDARGKCYRDVGVEPLSYQKWLGFIAFMNRPWFSRSWVVQELALAKKVNVVCGTRSIPWEQLAKTIEFVRATKWYHHLSTEKMRHIRELNHRPGVYKKLLASNSKFGIEPVWLNNTRNALQAQAQTRAAGTTTGTTSNSSPTLRMLVDTHRYTNATDPRDKVYAFLSLASRRPLESAEEEDSRNRRHHHDIEPNYQTSVRQVYIEAACTLLLGYQNLYLLSHVQDASTTKVKNLPSWVPDYSVPLSPYPLDYRGNCNWSACGNVKWTPPQDKDDMLKRGMLPVQGFHIDTVAETAVMPHEAADAGEPWASIVNMVARLPNPYAIPSNKGRPISRLDVLWRTLTTNTYSRQHPAPAECGELFIDYVLNLQIRHRLRPWSSPDSDFQPHQTPLSTLTNPDWRGLLESEPTDSPYNISFYRARLTALVESMLSSDSYTPIDLSQLHHDIGTGSGHMRRVFRTKEKMLLGTGPRSLRVGDEVWILAGGKVPYVLRQVKNKVAPAGSENRYRLIGEAYVHGLMHGNPYRFGKDLVSTVLI